MTTSPPTLPSPASSSSSNHHTPSIMSQLQPGGPARAPSAASHTSASGREPKYSGMSNGAAIGESSSSQYQSQAEYDDPSSYSQQTPQAHPSSHALYNAHFMNSNPATYLPQVTSSPPPHVPAYVPPPQHAMAPDPIHMPMNVGMMGGAWPQQMQGQQWRPVNGAMSPQAGPMPPSSFRQPLVNGHVQGMIQGHPIASPLGLAGAYGPGSMIGLSGGRPGSSHGEGRERRRDRDRGHRDDDHRDRDGKEDEVISTIFVVGFPDDMTEREFQNIFTFSPGFEAATLKFPSGSNRREPTASLLAELSQIAANQQAAAAGGMGMGEMGDGQLTQASLEEALAALQMGGNNSGSSSTTPSAAISLTPSAPSGPTFGNSALPQLPPRRQTIGFARFRTRAEAIAAKEHLQGRKIDYLTGSTLKAEMAKKNLHTKRTTSGEELVGLLLRSGKLAGLMSAAGHGQGLNLMANGPAGQPIMSPTTGMSISGNPGMPMQSAQPLASAREAWDSWPAQQSQPSGGGAEERVNPPTNYPYPISMSQTGGNGVQPHGISSQSNPSASPPLSVTSPNQRPTDSKALLALAEEADEMEGGWPLGGAVGFGMGLEGFGHNPNDGAGNNNGTNLPASTQSGPTSGQGVSGNPGPNPSTLVDQARRESITREGRDPREREGSGQRERGRQSTSASSNSTLSQLSQSNSVPNNLVSPTTGPYPREGDYSTSPPARTERLSDGMIGMNLGIMGQAGSHVSPQQDQNPPINTLYVGNLPAASPPTHPPNFLEESLRALFSRCPGYKRMSFRQKLNGPMCFVEFEDIPFATAAMKELYGHNLGGLIKGGIRLSYSKNSLGQRGSAHPPGINTPMFGGIAHTVALAGMSPTTTPSNAFGLQGLNGHSGPQSAPLPMPGMPGDGRRGSEGTSLSPTAQPFNASLPVTTSPRSRYFGTSPTNMSGNMPIKEPTSGSGSAGGMAFNSFSPTSNAGAQPIPTGPGNQGNNGGGQFSPVSSPIRTPQSISWVSSSVPSSGGMAGMMGNNNAWVSSSNPSNSAAGFGGMGGMSGMGGMGGNGAYGFEGFSPQGNGAMSLNGAASAWGQSSVGSQQ